MSKPRMINKIDLLFMHADADVFGSRVNPVTGGRWVPGLDPIGPQKMLAIRASLAREWFALTAPSDAQPLPLTYGEREDRKNAYLNPNRISYIVSLFGRSIAAMDYAYWDHPSWERYARGVLASPDTPDFIRNDPNLRRRYPPRTLPGLGPGLFWSPVKRPPCDRWCSQTRPRDRR